MGFIINDLSVCGQFESVWEFHNALETIMAIRSVIRKAKHELYSHRGLLRARVTSDLALKEAVHGLERSKRQALMLWLTQMGPFWDDERQHSPDEYFDCGGQVVTDSAVGEAAYCRLMGIDSSLVSFVPSDWRFSPVPVVWSSTTDGNNRMIDVTNYWTLEELKALLETPSAPPCSWEQLREHAVDRFSNLTFSGDCFRPLRGLPFFHAAAQRILALLDTLNRLKVCFDERGVRTAEGQRLIQEHFTGETAWFSDSSDTEMRQFRTELTFAHPLNSTRTIFCSWHGKVQTPPFRIHFSWPVTSVDPLYVVYVGPKLTKQ
jgi:hypothetical protein